MKRPLASLLAFLIIALSPGAPAYQAFAQTVGQSGSAATGSAGDAATSVNATNGAAGVAPVMMPAASLGLNPSLSPVAGAPVLNAAVNPSLAPAVANPGSLALGPVAAPAALNASQPAAAHSGRPVKAAVASVLTPASALPAAPLAVPAASGRDVKKALDEAGKKLADPDADPAKVIEEMFTGGVQRHELDALLAVPSKTSGLSKRANAALNAYKAARPTLAAPSVASIEGSPSAAAAPVKKSIWERIKSTFDMSEFTKSEKSYILGQAVFLLAISVYLASLPLLVKAMTGDAAMTGVARMVHYWVFGGASLFAGAVVGKTPMKRILVGAAGGRALLFGTIGALALFGGLPWAAFLVLVGVNSLLVAHNHLVDIDTGGAAKIFKGADQKSTDHKIEKAGYIYDFIYYGMMLVIPALIGLPMDWLDSRFGAGIGAGAGFAMFAALMGVVSYIYAKKVVTVGDLATEKLQGVRDALGRVWSGTKTFGRILFDIPRRNWQTAKIIFQNKAILARSSMATMENFVEDALFAVVLPTFAIDILKAGAFGNGLLLSAITAGGLVASMFLMKRVQALQKKHGTYKVLAGLTIVAALAFVPSIGLWMFPMIVPAMFAVFFMKLMLQPLRSRMRALLQTEIKNDPKAAGHADDIYSLMTFIEVIAAGAGGLAFAWLFHHSVAGSALALALGAFAPMKIITIVLVGMGLVYFGGLRWVKAQLSKPTRTVHKSPEGNEAKMLERLATSLKENGLPEFKTATDARQADDNEPVVVILAPSSRHKIALAREGGKQGPGLVNLVLDSSWLIQETYPDGTTMLLVTKGVVFDEKGQATVTTYETPRRVHYFANYFTLGANDRDDGVVFETNLDVPQSNSLKLETVVNDKLGTRIMMAARGVAVPATLALMMPLHSLAGREPLSKGKVQIADMPPLERRAAEVGRLVDQYLADFQGEELVVKPSGPQFHSGRGVKFFKKSERDAIVAHALALAVDGQMTEDGAVLLDERVNSAPLYRDGRKMETTGRILVARTPWGGTKTTGTFARVGPWGKPTTAEAADPRDNATVEPMEKLFAEWKKAGLLDDHGERELEALIAKTGEDALAAIAEREKLIERKDGESYQGQSDMIGLDVMIESRDGKLVPVIIEVNDHDSGGQYNLDQMHPDKIGEHSREWVATMLQRARRDALKDKRVVIVGAGYKGKRFIFEKAKKLGVEIVLVDKRTPFVDELLRDGLIAELIETDNSKPKEAQVSAKKKLLKSIRKNGKLDGMATFWEDDVPLTADLAKELGLPYHTQDAAKSVRSKAETRAVMAKAGLPTPRNRKVPSLATVADKAKAEKEFIDAIEFVGYPAVMKPAFGAAAMGVKRVNNRKEAAEAYRELSAVIDPKNDEIFKQGTDIVVEQYLDGREYDVDVVMRGGKPLFVSVTDNWPTREPYFLATGSTLPSRLLSAKEQKEAGELAIQTAQALGLTDGVVHIEGKYTKEGPRIIEANGRMGGEYVHDWVEAVWGVSLVEENLMAATGVGGKPFMAPKPLTHLEGEFLIPAGSGVISDFDLPESARLQQGFHELRVKKQVGDRIAVPPVGYERAGMLVARGATSAEAQKNLDALRANLILNIQPDERK
ncbi:MAG: ATP-grasp domain-containing protein [Elusimicrobia bacterium]|nr:ATP-grasp domain-containing protein [Elusimicrobiota bacterium]